MISLWQDLSAGVQDGVIFAGLLLPVVALGAVLCRGYRPWPLVRALLWRFRWANGLFVLLIAISVGTGIGLLAQERGLRNGAAQAADKFELVVTAPGSELTMMLASVFIQPTDVPLLDGALFNEVAEHPQVALAAPLAFGDSYAGDPVVGTTAEFIAHLTEAQVEGRLFERAPEAVIGARIDLAIGDSFVPAHGHGETADASAHTDDVITVVGRMAPTGSPWDKAILVPVESVWEVHGLANGHALEDGTRIGPPFSARHFPGTPAILVVAKEPWANYALRSEFTRDGQTMAFFPGGVLNQLYGVMGDVRQAMSLLTLVTQVLVAASVLLGLFILSRLFQRQLALLNALGAPGRFVASVVWCYGAALIGLGTVLGLGAGYGAAAVLSQVVSQRTDILIKAELSWPEFHLLAGFVCLTALAALVPAWAALRQASLAALRG